MRTTVTIQDSLLDAAKRRALEKRVTLSAVVEDALRASLSVQKQEKISTVCEPWPVYGSSGVQPGVDLRDNAGLLDKMGEE